MSEPETNPEHPTHWVWWLRGWTLLLICWLLVCTGTVLIWNESWKLGPSGVDHLLGLAFTGLIMGSLFFIYWLLLPLLLIIWIAKRWPRFRTCFVLLTMCALMSAWLVRQYSPATRIHRFETTTHLKWNTLSPVAEYHGWGLGDKRHLWVFQGTPAQFQVHLDSLPWRPFQDEQKEMYDPDSLELKLTQELFGKVASWSPAQRFDYFNMNDDDTSPPYGDATLYVDAEHQRWCLWWDGL